MSKDPGSQPASIKSLSVELVRMVLLGLPDVSSLRAAALSCPLFYAVFLDADTAITTEVLLNQIDVGVLPEAMLAFKSSNLRRHDIELQYRQAAADFMTESLNQRPTPPNSWPLEKALQLERLHLCVDELADRFTRASLATCPIDRSKFTATRQETCRIQRALYRFELYCNLFRQFPSREVQITAHDEENRLFFANFSPWENEQLGCINDFLVRAVSPAFIDIAEHDIAWGAFNVDYIDRIDSPYIQQVLSVGLEKLHSIILAVTYKERYQLLYCRGSPRVTYDFLSRGLQTANERSDRVFLDALSTEDEALHIKRPFFSDPDPGPRDAWLWAHQEESWANWVYQESRESLRRWGYVMWDKYRLDSVHVLQEHWEDTRTSTDFLEEEQEAGRERAYMQNSWERREQIFRSGGRGWWSWGDESHVQWRDRKRDRVEPGLGLYVPAHTKPGSLEEARDMLRMMTLP